MVQKMREHKYKAKRLDGQWVEGSYYAKPILNQYYILEDENQWIIDPDTLCESIMSLEDNKTKIYENDIVKLYIDNNNSINFLVWWNNSSQCVSAVNLEDILFNGIDYCNIGRLKTTYEHFCFMVQNVSKVKVIGNIFDNPELLEVK